MTFPPGSSSSDIPPPWHPFVPPFDPPGSPSPPISPPTDPPEGSSTDDDTSASANDERPDWWPEDWPWPPEPEGSTEVLVPPPRHVWPRLPPDHPYHLPPGFWWPDNMPPGHPGTPDPEDIEPNGSETSSGDIWV